MSVTRKKGPLYLQVKDILKDRILHGLYPVDTNIPSEIQLESEFNVSKITVRNAIKELVQDGFLEKMSGKGTRVLRNSSTSKLSKGKRFTEVLVDEGHKIQKELLCAEIIHNQKDTELYHLFGEKCFYIERLYYLDEVPYIHYTHYLESRQLDGIDLSDINVHSLYGLIETQGVSLEKFRDAFAVEIAPPHVEERLQIEKGTSLLKRSRYSYNEVVDLIEYSEGYYNTKKQQYIVNYDV
ncbi:GntR family transcriptional regulator [Gottfriedia acidiceleris]|uniref:GntR family transcriptional regulator n=1 Tax=Gottfriedia acidiceleris TaxID=371036 RepID=UPI000B44212F|nr:GntR family transcriptional regulator [Gottfriedia acidiceleris]